MKPEENMWYPGPDYKGREGDYAKKISECEIDEVLELVQQRACEDYDWIMRNGMASDSEERMGKMLAWVSNHNNITQCVQANLENDPTVDWVCRELGKITHKLGRPNG